MDAIPLNLQVMAWVMGGVLTFISLCVGTTLTYLLHNFLTRIEILFVKVEEHEGRIITLETLEGIECKK